jgi:predicted DNA-binding protein YlxM (UPF0122 family)
MIKKIPQLREENYLRQKYLVEKMSLPAIALELSCSRQAVHQALQKLGIETRSYTHKNENLLNDKEFLLGKHINENIPVSELCKTLGCTVNTLVKKLNGFDIPINKLKRGAKRKHIMLYDRDFLYQKYVTEKLSCAKISNLVGCPASTVHRCLRLNNLDVRKKNRLKK